MPRQAAAAVGLGGQGVQAPLQLQTEPLQRVAADVPPGQGERTERIGKALGSNLDGRQIPRRDLRPGRVRGDEREGGDRGDHRSRSTRSTAVSPAVRTRAK